MSDLQPPPITPPTVADEAIRLAALLHYRVLVADDDPVNQKMIRHLLMRLGVRAELVADGREAVAAVAATRFDVVLLDMQMPEMDGLTAARTIIAAEPDPRARPILVALTASEFLEDRVACLGAGMDDFLTKPVTLDRLHQALEAARKLVQTRRKETPDAGPAVASDAS